MVKKNPMLRLIFVLSITVFSLLGTSNGYAQQPKDSATGYYNTLLYSKQSPEVTKAFIFYEDKVGTYLKIERHY
jgi:hypothetical protein